MEQYYYQIAGAAICVESDAPLNENWQTGLFRTAAKEPALLLRIHLVDALPDPGNTLLGSTRETSLYLRDSRPVLETRERGGGIPTIRTFLPMPGEKIAEVYALRTYSDHALRTLVLWSAVDLPWLLLNHGVLTLHSASIDRGGKAVLFVAPSGTGKSTQARLWSEFRGAVTLNGDKNCVTLEQGRALALGTPFSGTSEICANYALPLEAVVLLRQAPENRITRLRGIRALKAALENAFGHRLLPGCSEALITQISALLSQVPVYELACTPDERAVITLENELERNT